MRNGKFISYLRVSTAQQGESGLGLEAQRQAVSKHLSGGDWTLVEEVREVESGKKNDRPGLAKALKLCRKHKAVLVIAKLDRLARNVAFISALMESGVEFEAVDIPKADKFTLHILAAVAEQEARAISHRTKVALQASKKRLGGRRMSAESFAEIAANGRQVHKQRATQKKDKVLAEIEKIQSTGHKTLRQIAAELNELEVSTPRGGDWTATQVMRVMRHGGQQLGNTLAA